MTIKSLLFCLFLYICLVWVGAAYLNAGTVADIVHYGLLWTAIGLIAVLGWIIVSRVVSWWRLVRARSAARPQSPAKPAPVVNPEDEALIGLLNEANAALSKSPAFVGKRASSALSTMPWYLLVGPEGTGKTSTFVNSGVEPILLAGQVSGTAPVVPTRMCNLWLARGAVFAEFGGRLFSGDIGRWRQMLRIIRGNTTTSMWRRMWGDAPPPQTDLRGVIAFCSGSEFTAASSDPQRLERSSRDWHDRLGAIAEIFGAEIPVYVVITNCDKIRFFSDFFRRLPDVEAGQVLGCSLPYREAGKTDPGEVLVEAEAKRLTASFRPLYHSLAERRVTQLAHEPDPGRRASIYEFPRELKRIRSPLVQFLTDVFRVQSLGPRPALRGYYLTAVREVEAKAGGPAGTRLSDTAGPMDATRLFRADVTQLFDATKITPMLSPKGSGPAWMFVADLFHKVVLRDQPPRKAQPVSGRLDRLHYWTFRAACGVCALLCFAFILSWSLNRELLSALAAAPGSAPAGRGNSASLADLQSLDALRQQIAKLEGSLGWSYHWGLYSGNRALELVRPSYFRRFRSLLLTDLNSVISSDLEALREGSAYDTAYRTLKAQMMITDSGCPVDRVFLSRSLKEFRPRVAPGALPDWQSLADQQIEFYVNESKYVPLPRLPQDPAPRDHARQYLQKLSGGIERLYTDLLAQTEKGVGKTPRLEDLAPNYTKVLSGPDAVSAAFSPAGWAFFENAAKQSNVPSGGDSCVLGETTGAIGARKQTAETAQAVQRIYFREYADRWRQYVGSFSVIRYTSADDAAKKLDILADHKSPLLAMLALTANQTYFPAAPGLPDSGVQKLKDLVGVSKKYEEKAKALIPASNDGTDGFKTPGDITQSFQPVDWVEPPGAPTWVGQKTQAYVDALGQLRHSMQDIAQSGVKDPAVHQTAGLNYDKALDTVKQVANGFNPFGVGGIDETVQRLLEAPIRLTNQFIIRDMDKAGIAKVNGDLHRFCVSQQSTFAKYPFQPSGKDASLEEFANVFDPAKGQFWKFQQQSLADLVVKEGAQWKPKDPAKKPQVTQTMLAFLNRAQQIRDAFFPAGATQPGFYYTLRPNLDKRWKQQFLELKVDGQAYQWIQAHQHQFSWPAPSGATDRSVVATMRTADLPGAPFMSEGGLWAIFRIMTDAEPRAEHNPQVEWKYSGRGRQTLMDVPVQVEIVDFPAGVDVFNPKFWQETRCPAVAVQ